MTGPVGWLRAVVIDAEDPERLSAFWQAVLGVGVFEVEQDWIQLERDRGGVYLAFQPLPAGGTAVRRASGPTSRWRTWMWHRVRSRSSAAGWWR